MNTDKSKTTTAKEEQPDFVKTIGKTTYRVKIHFNPNARETMSDKIIRMLRNEVQQTKT
jgi:phosphotransferase system IIB component